VWRGTSSSISPGASCPSDCAIGRTSSDQWDSVLGAGEHATKAGPDLFGSTASAVEQLWRSGFDVASHFAERSSSQLASSIGLSDDKAQQATEQSSRNIDAILQSTRAYADAFQSISRELSGFCKERLDRNLEKMSALMRSRTPQELIAAQSDLLRDNMEGFLQTSRRLAEASADVADKATRRLTEITRRAA
jgi:hypothetical protein